MANKPNNQAKKNSKTRMIRALLNLVQTTPLQDISISDLCAKADVNRTTFYNHYDNISGLAREAQGAIVAEYTELFTNDTNGYTLENLTKMFRHIGNNRLIYMTYFKLNPDYRETFQHYDHHLAEQKFGKLDEQKLYYHAEFFAAGITAIIKRWLANNCRESPEEMAQIVISEYHTG